MTLCQSFFTPGCEEEILGFRMELEGQNETSSMPLLWSQIPEMSAITRQLRVKADGAEGQHHQFSFITSHLSKERIRR